MPHIKVERKYFKVYIPLIFFLNFNYLVFNNFYLRMTYLRNTRYCRPTIMQLLYLLYLFLRKKKKRCFLSHILSIFLIMFIISFHRRILHSITKFFIFGAIPHKKLFIILMSLFKNVFRLGEDSCRLEPMTDSFTYTFAYLLLWDILLTLCDNSSTELRFQYADWLK